MELGLEHFNLALGFMAAALGLASFVALCGEDVPRLHDAVFALDLILVPAGLISIHLTMGLSDRPFDTYWELFPVVGASGLTELHFWCLVFTYLSPLMAFVIGAQAKNLGYLGLERPQPPPRGRRYYGC